MLTALILIPLIAALLVALAPARQSRILALLGAGITGILSIGVLFPGGEQADGFGWIQVASWFPNLGVSYRVGIDGISALLIVLTALLGFLATAVPFKVSEGRERGYHAALLAATGTTIGAFAALDLILFYVFFEACLVPIYLLIGVYGSGNKARAALKFFVFTVVGSLLMLAGIIALRLYAGSFELAEVQTAILSGRVPASVLTLAFVGFAAAFAVKTPLFPFHTWLPDAYGSCPAAGVVILSGAMAKLGTYGFLRFGAQLFPTESERFAPVLITLATIGIVYAALVAAVQKDVKRVVAYSSVSHLGYVVLGTFSGTLQGSSGAALQMVNHGITTAALFLIIGLLEDRCGTLRIDRLGGLWQTVPVFGRVFLIVTLSSVALPLTNGFVGEFLILLGTFQNYPIAAGFATTGAVWSAIYMLWMFQRVMYGEPRERTRVADLNFLERAVLGSLVVLIFAIGVAPSPFLKLIQASLPSAPASPRPTTSSAGEMP